MVLNNPLANVLSTIDNSERVFKKTVVLRNNSRVIKRVLDILKDRGYITAYAVTEDGRGGTVHVDLAGTINHVGVITPNFAVKLKDFQRYEKRYLPARGFGILVVSTSQGMMTHEEAKEKGIGGRLLAYCY